MPAVAEAHLRPAVEWPISRLLTLPVEIVIWIFRHVEFRDLKRLRLSCKFLCLLAEPILFHTIVVVPHLDSLQALVSLSEHPTIRTCVQIVFYDNRWGNFASWLSASPGEHGMCGQTAPPTASMPVAPTFALLEQLSCGALTKESIDVEIAYLSRAFSMLPSLSGFGCLEPSVSGVQNSEPVPNFYARFLEMGRFEGPRWDRVGYQAPLQGSWGLFSLFSAMFATRVSVPDLRIDDVAWNDMFQSSHRLRMLRAVLRPIRRLKISTQVDSRGGDLGGDMPRTGSIMACVPSLEDLDLEFRPGPADPGVLGAHWDGHDVELSHMPRPPLAELLPKETYFPCLTRLTLSGFRVEETDLISLLTRHAETLSTLRLGLGHLSPDADSGAEACWVRVIRRLQSDLHLKKMRFSRYLGNDASQSWGISEFRRYSRPGCLKERIEKFVVQGGTCPLEQVAVGWEPDEPKESHSYFVGDDSWWMNRVRLEPAPDGDESDD